MTHADHRSVEYHQDVAGLAGVDGRRTGDRIDASGSAWRVGRLQAEVADIKRSVAGVRESEPKFGFLTRTDLAEVVFALQDAESWPVGRWLPYPTKADSSAGGQPHE